MKDRKHIATHLYRLADGRYKVDMHESDGPKRQHTFQTRKAADKHIRRILNERDEVKLYGGVHTRPVRYLMLDAINDFETTKQHLRPASRKRYKPIFEQLRIFVTQHEIEYVDQFSSDDGTALFNALTAPRKDPKGSSDRILTAAPKTVNLFLQTTKGLFKHEIAKGHIRSNPLSHVENMSLEKKVPEFYTEDELVAFFAVEMDQAYRQAFLGLLLSGTRFAELANVRFEDVNLETGHIHVRPYDGFVTKTHNAERKIPMGEDLLAMMKEIIAEPMSSEFPFCTPTGKQLRERSLLTVCKRTGKRAGLTCRLFLHKFRHTYATRFLYAPGFHSKTSRSCWGTIRLQ